MLEDKIKTFGQEKFHILQKHSRKTNLNMKNKPYGLGGKSPQHYHTNLHTILSKSQCWELSRELWSRQEVAGDMICCLGTTKGSLGHCDHKKGRGRVVKMLASKAAASAWRSRILLAVQKSAEAHYWVTGREKDTSLLFFLKQREILPWDPGSHTNPDLFLNKQRMILCTDHGQRVLHSLLGTPLLQVFPDINLQKYSGIWRSREQNNPMETHIIASWLHFNV